MNQNQVAELFDTSKQNIGQHIANILKEGELQENSVVKNYFTTAADGKKYNVTFYAVVIRKNQEVQASAQTQNARGCYENRIPHISEKPNGG